MYQGRTVEERHEDGWVSQQVKPPSRIVWYNVCDGVDGWHLTHAWFFAMGLREGLVLFDSLCRDVAMSQLQYGLADSL